jgi:PHD/YefM family antitoxin component YafN of YafNO toxin-antitoxin module
MAMIRPGSELGDRYNEISEFCHTYNEPVFLTKNGAGDLVVLSNAEYERLSGKYELYGLLDEGLADIKAGRRRNAEEVFADIRKKFGFENV